MLPPRAALSPRGAVETERPSCNEGARLLTLTRSQDSVPRCVDGIRPCSVVLRQWHFWLGEHRGHSRRPPRVGQKRPKAPGAKRRYMYRQRFFSSCSASSLRAAFPSFCALGRTRRAATARLVRPAAAIPRVDLWGKSWGRHPSRPICMSCTTIFAVSDVQRRNQARSRRGEARQESLEGRPRRFDRRCGPGILKMALPPNLWA